MARVAHSDLCCPLAGGLAVGFTQGSHWCTGPSTALFTLPAPACISSGLRALAPEPGPNPDPNLDPADCSRTRPVTIALAASECVLPTSTPGFLAAMSCPSSVRHGCTLGGRRADLLPRVAARRAARARTQGSGPPLRQARRCSSTQKVGTQRGVAGTLRARRVDLRSSGHVVLSSWCGPGSLNCA